MQFQRERFSLKPAANIKHEESISRPSANYRQFFLFAAQNYLGS